MAREDQQTIPGTEPKLPPGVLRQAMRVLDLRDDMELQRQRLDVATEHLHSLMAKHNLQWFSVPATDNRNRVSFRLEQADPKVKFEDYKKPVLPGSEEAAA